MIIDFLTLSLSLNEVSHTFYNSLKKNKVPCSNFLNFDSSNSNIFKFNSQRNRVITCPGLAIVRQKQLKKPRHIKSNYKIPNDLEIDSPSEKSTLQVEPLTLAGAVFAIGDGALLLLFGVWTTGGTQEAASVLRGESSTAAFQISSCACKILPHWNRKEPCRKIT